MKNMISLRLGLLLTLIFFCFNSFGQIQEANNLLGTRYNKVYDKVLNGYQHKVFTNNDTIIRVDIYVDIVLRDDYKDLINHLLDHYKANSDSISYDVQITESFCFDNLVYVNDVSEMYIYSGRYFYCCIIDKKRKRLTLQHYLNE